MDSDTRHAAHTFLGRVAEHYPLAAAFLFGSRVHTHYRPDSDVDIAVILNGPNGDFVETKLASADIAYDVLLETGVYIQPLPVWKNEWEHPQDYTNPGLLNNIKREGLRL